MEELYKIACALTRAVEAQPELQQLFDYRQIATYAFRSLSDPWVIELSDPFCTIGPLGIINGIIALVGVEGRIAAHYDDTGRLTGFWPCDENGKPVAREEL